MPTFCVTCGKKINTVSPFCSRKCLLESVEADRKMLKEPINIKSPMSFKKSHLISSIYTFDGDNITTLNEGW